MNKAIPNDPNLIYQEGLAAVEASNAVKLESSIEALKKYPEFAGQRKLLEGMLILGKSKPLLAIPMFQEAAKEPKIRIKALTMLGNAYMRSSQSAKCVATFETALQEDPDTDEARLTLAFVLKDMISWDEAQKHLAVLMERKYKPDVVHQMLGDMYAELDRPADAANEYAAALKADPNNPSNSLRASRLVKCRLQTGDLSGLDEFLPGVDSAGVRESANAMLLMEKDEAQKALSGLEHALHESPVDATANLAYAKVMEKIGTREKAIEALVSLQRPLSIQTRNASLLEVVARLATIAGDEKMAVAAQQNVEQLRDLESQFAEKLNEVIKTRDGAEARMELGDLALAIGRYEFAGSIYHSVSFIDQSKESVYGKKLRAHMDLQPMLVPIGIVDAKDPAAATADPVEPAPAPVPEPAPGSAPPESEKGSTPEPDATPSPDASSGDEPKKPEAKAE